MIEKLESAIELIRLFNSLSFERVLELLKEECGLEFSNEVIEDWKFIGLNNVDFIKIYKMKMDYLTQITVEKENLN